MPVTRALKAFREERLNCAQSVLKAYKDRHGVSDEQILQAKADGGGRAVDGMCGALYAAVVLAGSEDDKSRICAEFEQVAGARRCRDIKSGSGYPCDKCVELAAELVDRHL